MLLVFGVTVFTIRCLWEFLIKDYRPLIPLQMKTNCSQDAADIMKQLSAPTNDTMPAN